MNHREKRKYDGGAAMLIAVIFFLFLSMTIVLGIVTPILKQATISKNIVHSKESYYLAEGVMEDALYRMKQGMGVTSGDIVSLNGYSTTITITNTSNGKIIETEANRDGVVRKMRAQVIAGVGAAFNYGIQAGSGGFILNGGSEVVGNVYSNGDIVATNGVTITGSATAANSVAISADQANETPIPPPNTLNFRNTSASQDFAQSFQLDASAPLNKISFYVRKVGSPANATVRIVTNSGTSPSTTNMLTTQGSLSAAQVSSSNFGWVDVVFPDNPELIPGTTYWVVLDNSSQNSNNYYQIGGNTSYADGMAKVGSYGGTWNATSPANLDGYFKIYLGGLTSTIGGSNYVGGVNIGSGGIGNAHAHHVQGALVAGSLYCQTGSSNNKACDTSLPDPAPVPYPISDSNIQDWKDEASSGGVTSGNVTVGWQGALIGPRKITGNLLVNGGGTLTVTGTIWVEGTITVNGGGKIKLASSYGANGGVVLADGIVSLGGGGELSGSGQAGSYLMILTTSACPFSGLCGGVDALTISGGAGAVILNAQSGAMTLNGGSGVKEATAYLIRASGGAEIIYETGLADINFSSGPSGGYSISSWKEVE